MSRTTQREKWLSDLMLWQTFQRKGTVMSEEFSGLFEPERFDWGAEEDWLDDHTDVMVALQEVDHAIDVSQQLLGIAADWDGDGAVPYDADTLQRATNLARSLCWMAVDKYGRRLESPDISAADQGSIDLFWRVDDRYLLINVPAAPSKPYTFYGESDGGESLGGTATGLRADLLVWLLGA